MTTLHDKIAALPEWPKEENYATPMKLRSGVQVTYSYPADEIRCMSDQLDAALARLALAREWIAANDRPCSREEILAALEGPK